MRIGKVIKIHTEEVKQDTKVRSVPVRPSRRHDNVRRAVQDAPPLTVPEVEPERVKVKP
jgi:hypothetical protein